MPFSDAYLESFEGINPGSPLSLCILIVGGDANANEKSEMNGAVADHSTAEMAEALRSCPASTNDWGKVTCFFC